MYATDLTHRQSVNQLATVYINKFSTITEWKVVYGAKGLLLKHNKSPFVEFVFLKSKTEVHLYIDCEDGKTIPIPQYATFKAGAVQLTVDKKYVKEGRHEQVLSYINELYE